MGARSSTNATRLHGSIAVTSPIAESFLNYKTTRRHHSNTHTYIYKPPYTVLHSKWRILFPYSIILLKGKHYLWLATPPFSKLRNPFKRETLPMARDPTSPTALQTDPQHGVYSFLKGNPTCGSRTHPWLATN